MSTENLIKNSAATHASKTISALLGCALLLASAPAHSFLARPVIFAALGNTTMAPGGWLKFCAREPEECKPATDAPRDVILTPDLLQQLFRINAYVNDRVKWTSDIELHGQAEQWAYPLD
jgi:predicted transglutaminase-like cysteine proteinase